MLARLKIDPFLIVLVAVLALASIVPVRGDAARAFDRIQDVAIALLFFLHGAKLSRGAILAGIGAWQLHLAVLFTTFGLFPLLGLAALAVVGTAIDPLIGTGILFLAILPSTVQSSIAFTAIARGNVPAAVCSASLSNLIGIVLTPLLAALLIGGRMADGSFFLSAVVTIASQLLGPFILGHVSRPWLGAWIDRHRPWVMRFDRGVILLVVYTAFSAAVVEGLWTRLSAGDLGMVMLVSSALLAAVLGLTGLIGRWMRLERPDAAVLTFCGSKKSLASGVPMASALFPSAEVGMIILPLMLFHQLQLIVCSIIAGRHARRDDQAGEMNHVAHGA
ncbi:bile acid:sodium symporter family protein [Sphingomonas sp. CJ99]